MSYAALCAAMRTDLSWSVPCRGEVAAAPGAAKYEPEAQMVATGWKMKAMLVLTLVLLTAATVMAYGGADVASMAAAVSQTAQADEPITLLLSGSALIALGGALRRLTA